MEQGLGSRSRENRGLASCTQRRSEVDNEAGREEVDRTEGWHLALRDVQQGLGEVERLD